MSIHVASPAAEAGVIFAGEVVRLEAARFHGSADGNLGSRAVVRAVFHWLLERN